MEIVDFFVGNALNAVDGKGRVSLPSDFRGVIERRARAAAAAGVREKPDEKFLYMGEHERHGCLQAYEPTYQNTLFEALAKRAANAGEDEFAALDDAQADAFGAMLTVSFDAAGRMVLPGQLRGMMGIVDHAFFVGAGQTFQIWDPRRFLKEQADKARVCRTLRYLMGEKGIAE